MNPLQQAIVLAVVRWLITTAATYGVTVSTDTATQVVSGLVAAGALGWSVYQKHRVDAKIKKVAAGANP